MMRHIRRHEDIKVPVMKNIIYAVKIVWQADKNLFIGSFINQITGMIFSLFIQNILFLKVLLTAIDGNADFKVYIKYLVIFLLTSLFIKAAQWYGSYINHNAQKKALKNLNNKIFEKACQLDVSCYEDPAFYDKYQRATNVLSYGYFDTLADYIAIIVGALISFICVITTVTIIDPAYLLFLLPVLFVFAIELLKSKVVYKRDLEMTTNNRVKAYIQRTVFLKDYSKDMRTSNIFAVLMKRFDAAIKSNIEILKKYGVKLFIYSMISSTFSEFIPIVSTYAYAGYQFVYKDTMTISGFSVVLSSINSVREATLNIADGFETLSQLALYFQNLRDFFDYEPKVVSGSKTAGKFESLEFKNVSFRYPSADKYSLENVNLKITKGETVAVVGINGAGKSTLVKLLLRFYDPVEGEILYNGINIKEYDLDSYRERFATVFQDYKNFAISVFENVMCHECTDEDKAFAEKALRQSGVWEKISTFANGGDTLLTREFDEEGAGLSGGENQKVSTARLFARKFDIAVLDEPSSALDPIAEYKMYENLISATENKTVIYISHRLSSAVLSDKIFVLGVGRVIESGKHTELMAQKGEYSKMFDLQSKSYKEESADE
ncbi:MAG: ABC transporter ATP-binding protein [Eubacterium sp.]|nr:ABC transporter ATP-binding protein [Eubacterium sp.]